MTTEAVQAAPQRPRRRRQVRRFVPPQHGAWAMLLLPYVAGVLTVGFRWPHLPLLGTWLAGYLLSYYALQAIKTRRVQRFRAQLILHGALTAGFGLLLLAARPAVLAYAVGYAPLLAVNAWYAWRRRERAVVNDLSSVVQSCLIVFVTATVAEVPLRSVALAFTTVLLYFAGTVLYVKTMIRERGNSSYRRASVRYHLVAVVVAAWLNMALAVVFALLLARAWALPGRQLRPRHVGLIEIAACLLLLGAILIG